MVGAVEGAIRDSVRRLPSIPLGYRLTYQSVVCGLSINRWSRVRFCRLEGWKAEEVAGWKVGLLRFRWRGVVLRKDQDEERSDWAARRCIASIAPAVIYIYK